jgi:hypothetical protein
LIFVEEIKDGEEQKNINAFISKTFKTGKRFIKDYYSFYMVIEGFFMLLYFEFFQVYLEAGKFDIRLFGLLYAVMVLPVGFGEKYSHKIKNPAIFLKLVFPFSILVCITGLLIPTKVTVPIIFFILRFIWGAFSNTFDTLINHNIKDSTIRASVISLGSLIIGLFSSLLYVGFGALFDVLGLQHTTISMIVIFLGCYVVSLTFFSKKIINIPDSLQKKAS